MINDFSQLDAQSEESRLAQIAFEEDFRLQEERNFFAGGPIPDEICNGELFPPGFNEKAWKH